MKGIVVSVVAVAVASVSFATPAHAQFRDFIKKKIADKAVEKVMGSKKDSSAAASTNGEQAGRYTSSVIGEELTDDAIDAAIRGMQAEVGSKGRADSLDGEIDMSLKQRASVDEQQAYGAGADRYKRCVGSFLNQLDARLILDMSKRAQNRGAKAAELKKWEEAYVAYTMNLTRLMQQGDSAGLVKLRRDFWHSVGRDIDTRADTLAAEKSGCGAAPLKSAGILAQERVNGLRETSRQYREQYHDQGAKASGLPAVRYGLAVARIHTWWEDMGERAAVRDGSASRDTREHAAFAERFWSGRESKLLESRREQLTPLMWKLYGLRGW